MITINNGIIHLRNTHMSYILEVLDQKYILQRYMGNLFVIIIKVQ